MFSFKRFFSIIWFICDEASILFWCGIIINQSFLKILSFRVTMSSLSRLQFQTDQNKIYVGRPITFGVFCTLENVNNKPIIDASIRIVYATLTLYNY